MRKFSIVLLLLMSMVTAFAQNPNPKKDYIKLANYDESKIPNYTLPDVMVCNDGTRVTSKNEWEKKRRPEVLAMLTEYMYGKMPVVKKRLPATVTTTLRRSNTPSLCTMTGATSQQNIRSFGCVMSA